MSSVPSENEVKFNNPNGFCPIGEITGEKNISRSKIPVLSCEGACIRGEIARLAANIVSKGKTYGRGCHGELITVPQSAISRWIMAADKVVLIDGCFLRCHGRILENIIDKEKLIQFDALSHHKKYNDVFDYDDVPEEERKEVAQSIANWVIDTLNDSPTVKVSSRVVSGDRCAGCKDS